MWSHIAGAFSSGSAGTPAMDGTDSAASDGKRFKASLVYRAEASRIEDGLRIRSGGCPGPGAFGPLS
jgi:hypothetical protein